MYRIKAIFSLRIKKIKLAESKLINRLWKLGSFKWITHFYLQMCVIYMLDDKLCDYNHYHKYFHSQYKTRRVPGKIQYMSNYIYRI